MDPWSYHSDSPSTNVPLALLPQLVDMTRSLDEREVLLAVQLIRKLLSVEQDPPIQAVVDTGVCEGLVVCMKHANSEVQQHASWVLTKVTDWNIANTQYVIDLGAVPLFVQHLSSSNTDCVKQAAWAIHNLVFPSKDHFDIAIPLLALMLQHPDLEVVARSLWALSCICGESEETIQLFIDSGVPSLLINILNHSVVETFQKSALTILGNLVTGSVDQTQCIVNLGAVSVWVQHLSNPNMDSVKEAAAALSFIVSEGTHYRDYVLEMGAMPPLLAAFQTCPREDPRLLKTIVGCIAGLCSHQPRPPLEHTASVVPLLVPMIRYTDDIVALSSLKALSCICGESNDRAQLIIDSGAVPLIVDVLNHGDAKCFLPALRILGNISHGSAEQTQVAIDAGCLGVIRHYLNHQRTVVRKEAAWLLSNICAGSFDQIQSVIDAGLLPAIISTFGTTVLEVKREAVWACANLATNGTPEQVRCLADCGALEALCEMLPFSTDIRIINVALEAIESFLVCGIKLVESGINATNIYVERIRSFQGDLAIRDLLLHPNEEIQLFAHNIFYGCFQEEGAFQ